MASPRYPIELVAVREIAPRHRELTWRRLDGEPITYVPGQFFSIHFTTPEGEQSRSYSVVNRCERIRDNQELQFIISEVPGGRASRFFFEADVGQQAAMSGPFGALILPPLENPDRYLLIATGTGVAPYRSMLPQLARRLDENPGLEVVLVQGVRRPDELIYGEEFRAFARNHPHFRFIACYSREMPANPQAEECSGRVQGRFESLAVDPERDRVYLCGNPEMVEESATWFSERGFRAANLKREAYRFSTL